MTMESSIWPQLGDPPVSDSSSDSWSLTSSKPWHSSCAPHVTTWWGLMAFMALWMVYGSNKTTLKWGYVRLWWENHKSGKHMITYVSLANLGQFTWNTALFDRFSYYSHQSSDVTVGLSQFIQRYIYIYTDIDIEVEVDVEIDRSIDR